MAVVAHLGTAAPAARDWARAGRWLMLGAVLLGMVYRVAQYAADQSYWADEAALVLNIRTKPVPELLGQLDYAQAAPPLYLLAERGLFLALGGSEMSLRLLPLACGIGAILAFACVSRRILPAPWDALATALLAMSDRVIYHDTEVKPYGSDLFVAALFLLVAVAPAGGRSPSRRLAMLAAMAVVAVWFSFPAVIVFCALSLALMPAIVLGHPRGWLRYALLNLPVVVSFAIVFFITRSTQHDATLVDYWKDSFVDWHKPLMIPIWILRHVYAVCDYSFYTGGPVICAGAIIGGVVLLRTGRRELLAMLVGPIAVTIMTAAARRYPLDGARLTLFLSPGVLLLAVFGLKAIVDLLFSRLGRATLIPVGYLLGVGAYLCGMHLISPRSRGHLRPVAAFVRAHIEKDDTIYVFDPQAFRCYWDRDDPRIRGFVDRADQIPTRRFWIVWEYTSPHGHYRTDGTLKWANTFCRQGVEMYGQGGAAVLFERDDGKMPHDLKPPYNGINGPR